MDSLPSPLVLHQIALRKDQWIPRSNSIERPRIAILVARLAGSIFGLGCFAAGHLDHIDFDRA